MNELTGTLKLIGLILRRDRIVLPIWIIVIGLLPVSIGASFKSLYALDSAREAFANGIINSPAQIAMIGPLFSTTIEGLTAWRLGASGPALLAVAAFLTVIRHTRSDEEAGRRELVGASVIGRGAPLAAALIVALTACAILALITSLAMISIGFPLAGSLTLGFAIGVLGWVFAGVGALTAQLSETSGGAKKLASLILGATYGLRMVGGGTGQRMALLALSDRLGATDSTL